MDQEIPATKFQVGQYVQMSLIHKDIDVVSSRQQQNEKCEQSLLHERQKVFAMHRIYMTAQNLAAKNEYYEIFLFILLKFMIFTHSQLLSKCDSAALESTEQKLENGSKSALLEKSTVLQTFKDIIAGEKEYLMRLLQESLKSLDISSQVIQSFDQLINDSKFEGVEEVYKKVATEYHHLLKSNKAYQSNYPV